MLRSGVRRSSGGHPHRTPIFFEFIAIFFAVLLFASFFVNSDAALWPAYVRLSSSLCKCATAFCCRELVRCAIAKVTLALMSPCRCQSSASSCSFPNPLQQPFPSLTALVFRPHIPYRPGDVVFSMPPTIRESSSSKPNAQYRRELGRAPRLHLRQLRAVAAAGAEELGREREALPSERGSERGSSRLVAASQDPG